MLKEKGSKRGRQGWCRALDADEERNQLRNLARLKTAEQRTQFAGKRKLAQAPEEKAWRLGLKMKSSEEEERSTTDGHRGQYVAVRVDEEEDDGFSLYLAHNPSLNL
uniref:Uncharacterized protein n=1 Tax=Cucumis sativus TaxID=3659 RepID=A0A0A0KZ29_CUCSA